jgi:hypothetical protein
MGSSIGPLNTAVDNLSISLDASNTSSYSGSGNTTFDLITRSSSTLSSVTYSSSGSVGFYVYSGAGNITSSNNVDISGANSRTLSCWVYFTSKTIQSFIQISFIFNCFSYKL